MAHDQGISSYLTTIVVILTCLSVPSSPPEKTKTIKIGGVSPPETDEKLFQGGLHHTDPNAPALRTDMQTRMRQHCALICRSEHAGYGHVWQC